METSSQKHAGWVKVVDRLPEQYRAVRVKLVDGAERVGRLNIANFWQLAGFKADDHKYQYQGNVAEWFDERDPLIEAAPELLEALQLVMKVCGFQRGESPTFDRAFAAIAKATGSAA